VRPVPPCTAGAPVAWNRETRAITAVAGTGTFCFGGAQVHAVDACLDHPSDVVVDGSGNMFIASMLGSWIDRVDAATGYIHRIAGNGTAGFSGDNGPALDAKLAYPSSIELDGAGNLYIADTSNSRIRKLHLESGIITTVVGTGHAGFSGDGAQATEADINYPKGLTFDGGRNLFFVDGFNQRIRRVDAQTGIIETVAGTGEAAFSGDNGPASSATFDGLEDVDLDCAGNLYIADVFNNRIRRITQDTGITSTVAGSGDDSGGFAGDNGPATEALLSWPGSLFVRGTGSIFISDGSNERIRRVDLTTGIITTVVGTGENGFAGNDGPAHLAQLWSPDGVWVDGSGALFIADWSNDQVRKVSQP